MYAVWRVVQAAIKIYQYNGDTVFLFLFDSSDTV